MSRSIYHGDNTKEICTYTPAEGLDVQNYLKELNDILLKFKTSYGKDLTITRLLTMGEILDLVKLKYSTPT